MKRKKEKIEEVLNELGEEVLNEYYKTLAELEKELTNFDYKELEKELNTLKISEISDEL